MAWEFSWVLDFAKSPLIPGTVGMQLPHVFRKTPFYGSCVSELTVVPIRVQWRGHPGLWGGHFLTCLKIYVNLPVVESWCDPAFSCKGLRHASRLAAFRRGRDVLSQPQGTP